MSNYGMYLSLFTSAYLFYASFIGFGRNYSMYVVLKWLVAALCFATAFHAFFISKESNKALLYNIAAWFFNPLTSYSRKTWLYFDLLYGLLFLYAAYYYYDFYQAEKQREEYAQNLQPSPTELLKARYEKQINSLNERCDNLRKENAALNNKVSTLQYNCNEYVSKLYFNRRYLTNDAKYHLKKYKRSLMIEAINYSDYMVEFLCKTSLALINKHIELLFAGNPNIVVLLLFDIVTGKLVPKSYDVNTRQLRYEITEVEVAKFYSFDDSDKLPMDYFSKNKRMYQRKIIESILIGNNREIILSHIFNCYKKQ